jgi:hypothetical protein
MRDRFQRPWAHPWQVVRQFDNGALVSVCSHRTEAATFVCSTVRGWFNPHRDYTWYDYRRTPKA